jgi:hypothetical protein
VQKCGDSLSLLLSLRDKIRRRNEGERTSLVVTRRGLSTTRRIRLVTIVVKRGTLRLCTGVSGRSRDQHVRSSTREATKHVRLIGRCGALGHDRLDASGRKWVLTGNDRTLALWHLCVKRARPIMVSRAWAVRDLCDRSRLVDTFGRLVAVGVW